MSRSLTSRLAAQSLFKSPNATANALRCPFQAARPLSHTAMRRADDPPPPPPPAAPFTRTRTSRPNSASLLENIYGMAKPSTTAPPPQNAMASLSQSLVFQSINQTSRTGTPNRLSPRSNEGKEDEYEPFHFHIYSTKHNTHITATRPNREPIISLSCGNIGFRKSRRGTFDAAYSLTKYVIERLIHGGWPMKISRLEVVLRGFGQGREASLKVLMSPEGKVFRDKIVRVADSTRIKFGGTRSEKPRRL